MFHSFFPATIFGWVFVLVLATLLGFASWIDFRKMIVPKWVTVSCAALGVILNIIRGAWLGSEGQVTWLFNAPGPLTGALDGLLFSLAGFAVGFVVFFALWILGVCGGGDVKLVAAVGAWLGPRYILGAVIFSFPVVILLICMTYVAAFIGYDMAPKGPVPVKGMGSMKPRRRLLTFSLPLTVATLFLLLLGFRFELALAVPPPPPQVAATGG